jgi:nucleoside diphosphate kinase
MPDDYNFGKVPMTVCVIKPDAVETGMMQKILTALEKHGFILLQQDMQMMTTTKARALYKEHESADFFKPLLAFMTSAPVNAVLMTHSSFPDPVAELRDLVGPTNSEKARADAPNRYGATILLSNSAPSLASVKTYLSR